MNKLIWICLLLMTGNAMAQKSDAMKWMMGSWVLKTSRGDMVETWSAVDDSTYLGKSVMVKAPGDSLQQETIELRWRNRAWWYVPVVQGQNANQPVLFSVIFLGRDEFIAQSPGHDFPQRIAYRRVRSQLFASIEGSRAGRYSKINFDFTLAGH